MAWTFGRRAPAGEPDTEEGRKERVLQMLAAFRGKAPAIVAGTPPGTILRTDIYYHEWDECWGEGRVTLIGDAAHAVPTVLGQGACQAIEDAVVLADALAAASEPAAGLRDYEARRIDRVRFIRDKILSLMGLPKISNPVVLWLGRKLLRVVITLTQGKLWRTLQQPPELRLPPVQQGRAAAPAPAVPR
jgi:2-polyprenyl-6-methoxyphenol hydroxylase-like FAD-dependent oxidoreductase